MTLNDEELFALSPEILTGDPILGSGTCTEVGICVDTERGGLDGGDTASEEVSFWTFWTTSFPIKTC